MQGVSRRLRHLDQRALDRLAAVESPLMDRVLPRLSEAANYGRLWLGVAAALAVTGRRDARRAAARGLVSLALASATANVLAKGLSGRPRPHTGRVPHARRLRRDPVTTSFPSGHSASAAAFATGAVLEMPSLAVPVGCLAAAVIASRVVTGAHYPTDVLAGSALGIGAAALTSWWWPRRTSVRPVAPRQSAAGS